MDTLEQKIKDFVREQGVEVVGLAGPERLYGPPSTDVTYTLKGAKSIVSLAMPMDVNAIYDFLSKKCQTGHNQDQLVTNMKMNHLCSRVAGFIQSQGFRARAVPVNNSYRRSPDPFATHPSFSHRFGAIAAGIGAQGFSGNVMTRQYGASVYLGTVVTEAVLKSDPALSPRHFIDNYCYKCRACSKACVASMFIDEEEEYVLLNDELHPRGKRRDINLCNASCFGLHNLSADKKWSSWGRHWIDSWVDGVPDPKKHSIRNDLLLKGATAGDSTMRYWTIRQTAFHLYPEDYIKPEKLGTSVADMPKDELEQRRFRAEKAKKYLGVKIDDPSILTCGQCALVCGPTVPESMKRLKMLHAGGIVVSGREGRMVVAKDFEEARRIKHEYPVKVPVYKMLWDTFLSTNMWFGLYFGFEPKSIFGNLNYQRRMKKAIADKITGHKNHAASNPQMEPTAAAAASRSESGDDSVNDVSTSRLVAEEAPPEKHKQAVGL